jgi:hypothetical protein
MSAIAWSKRASADQGEDDAGFFDVYDGFDV